MKFELKEKNIDEFLKIMNKIMNIDINIIYYDELNYYYIHEINKLNEFKKNNNLTNNEFIVEFIIDNNKKIHHDLYEIYELNKLNINHQIIDVINNKIIVELFDLYEIDLYELNENVNKYYMYLHYKNFKKFNSYYNNKKTLNEKNKMKKRILTNIKTLHELLNIKYSYKSIMKINF